MAARLQSKLQSVLQPNQVDRKRIERKLKNRARYRYVHPSVISENGGYRIESPCCSRNVDHEGGVIDIARLEYANGVWRLYRKDHRQNLWLLHAETATLSAALDILLPDSERVFWP
jgi:hypothetical protein